MPIQPTKEGVAHFASDPSDPALGRIFAADGSRSCLISSRVQAELCILLFVEFGYLSAAEMELLEGEIAESSLPIADGDNDLGAQVSYSVFYQSVRHAKDDPSPDFYPWEIGSDEIEEDGFQLVCRRPIVERA